MDSRTLNPAQTERLRESLRPQLQYLRRLIARMDKVGFVAGDPLYQRVKTAYTARQRCFHRRTRKAKELSVRLIWQLVLRLILNGYFLS